MAKMRVYDLAKELGIESKQIIETLNTTEYAVKAASSNIDDPAQDIVRKKFGKSAAAENTAKAQNKENVSESKPAENKTAAPENKPAQKPQANEQNKPAEGAKTENAEQRPKKKSSITAVFNAQYSKQAAAAAAITTDVLEMVTDARGMATAVHRDRIQTAAMRRQDRHPVMM